MKHLKLLKTLKGFKHFFVNELVLIFDRIGIDTTEVIEASATMEFFNLNRLVKYCISVDPYYLAYKAEFRTLPWVYYQEDE